MPDFEREPERAWDEYDWERFLQQQDQKTEKYMELLEKYLDDPQRDEIIAREMGWSQLLDGKDWSAEVDALLNEDWRSNDEEPSPDEDQKPVGNVSRTIASIARRSRSRFGSTSSSIKTHHCKTSPRRSNWRPIPPWPAQNWPQP